MNKLLWPAVGVAALALAAALGWRLWPVLFPAPAFKAEQESNCDLNRSACRAVFADGSQVRLRIEPHPIPALKPLQLHLEADSIEINRAAIGISGIEMNMGYFHYPLQTDGKGRFSGTGVLPVCTWERMPWQAVVDLDTARGKYRAEFHFDVVK